MTRFLKTGGIIFLIIYIIGCTALYFIQDDIIFRPTPLNDNTSYRWGQEVYIDVAEGIQLVTQGGVSAKLRALMVMGWMSS